MLTLDKNILFVQDEQCRILDLEVNGESVWDAVLFSDSNLLEKYKNVGEKTDIVFMLYLSSIRLIM